MIYFVKDVWVSKFNKHVKEVLVSSSMKAGDSVVFRHGQATGVVKKLYEDSHFLLVGEEERLRNLHHKENWGKTFGTLSPNVKWIQDGDEVTDIKKTVLFLTKENEWKSSLDEGEEAIDKRLFVTVKCPTCGKYY